MNSSIMQIAQMFKTIKNPQQAIFSLLGNNTNPMAKQVLEMAKNGDKQGIEQFARNVCKEKGIDFDKEFSNFANNFK